MVKRLCWIALFLQALGSLNANPSTIRVVYNENYPYEFTQDGVPSGVDIEVAQILAQKLGLGITFQRVPLLRAELMLRTGAADLKGAMVPSDERERYSVFVGPVYTRSQSRVFLVPLGQGVHLQSYADLFHRTVGVVRGRAYFAPFDSDRRIPRYELNENSPTEESVAMLRAGHLDAVIVTEFEAQYILRDPAIRSQVELARYRYPMAARGRFAISKASFLMEKKDEISDILSRLVASGDLSALYAKFLDH